MQELVLNSKICILPKGLSASLCQDIIVAFDQTVLGKGKGPGRTVAGVQKHIKNSMDVKIDPGLSQWQTLWKPLDEAIYKNVSRAYKMYTRKYANLGQYPISDTGYNIQRYGKGSGHYSWHADGGSRGTLQRMCSVLIYLNTVARGGETEFKYFNLRVKPTAGTILLTPPFWTHLHRARQPLSGPKYIITSFMILTGPNYNGYPTE